MSTTQKQANNALFSTLKSLHDTVSPSIAPKGTYKLLHKPNSDVMITKSGYKFISNVQMATPLAKQIVQIPESISKTSYDGSIQSIVFMNELVNNLESYLKEDEHPRKLFAELSKALIVFQSILSTHKLNLKDGNEIDKDLLSKYVYSLVATKINNELADHLSPIIVTAILTTYSFKMNDENKDSSKTRNLNYGRLIEIFEQKTTSTFNTKHIKGLVLDHGPRHPLSPDHYKNCYILNTNINLELETTEVHSLFVYKDAGTKDEMSKAEWELVNRRLDKIVEIKDKVAKQVKEKEGKEIDFLLINYGGIDPVSLEYLHNNGISALRRCKRRNMERIGRICGGYVLLNTDNISMDKVDVNKLLGYAGKVTVNRNKDDVFTYLEEVRNPTCSTIVLMGPTQAKLSLMRDATEQAIMSTYNALENGIVKGAGNVEMVVYKEMEDKGNSSGYNAFRNALLSVPRAIAKTCFKGATNKVQQCLKSEKMVVEINEHSDMVYDGFSTKREIYNLGTSAIMNFLLIDKIILPKGSK
eukprot:GAHX01000784.1.p1 GENE.GAHX01000784.1~~GAHX01000784.1.p1  ORF type:complete len:544 (+),score=127.47 GAHX01000784.1:51-1634(+)